MKRAARPGVGYAMNKTEISLPPPQLKGRFSLEEMIAKRRSVRTFLAEPLTLSQLGQILWAAQGLSAERTLKTAPSAGATYPLEIFVLIGKQSITTSEAQLASDELQAGIYHYEAQSHSLRLHKPGDSRPDLARAAVNQEFVLGAPVDIVICALYHRTCSRYGKRGERYTHMEVGHVGENIHLQAVALDLATVEVGAFHDEEVREILGVEEHIRPLYIMPVGHTTSKMASPFDW